MILVSLPARMVCIEKGCQAEEPAEMALLGTGTFCVRPSEAGKAWQVTLQAGNPGAPFVCRCPQHKREVLEVRAQIGPTGPRMVKRDGH